MLRDYIQLPRSVHILCAGAFINRAGSFFTIFLTIYLSDQLGLGIRFATLAIGISGIGSMAGAIVGGLLADQIGRKPVMLLALFGSAVMLLVLSFIQQPIPFMGAVFLFAFIADTYRPAGSAMIGDLVTSENRHYSFGLMYIAINLGFAVAPPLGGLLAELSFKLLFWGDAVTTALFGFIILWFIPETLPGGAGQGDDQNQRISLVQTAKQISGDTSFMLFCLASLLNAIVFMQGMSTLPIFMMDCGFTKMEFGSVIAINGVLIVILQLPLTHWLSRFDRMVVIAIGGLLISTGFGMIAFGNSLGFIAIAIVVWTFGEMFQAPFKHAVVTDLAPTKFRGRYLGLFTMCYSSALTIGAPIGGAIMADYGAAFLWKSCFFVGAIAIMLYVAIRPGIQRRSHSARLAAAVSTQ